MACITPGGSCSVCGATPRGLASSVVGFDLAAHTHTHHAPHTARHRHASYAHRTPLARVQVIAEDMKEGTPIFTIRAHLPVVEAFGFATELRKHTSGAAHPQLVFSHFAPMEQDPNFVVATEEQQEALDDGHLPSVNLARKLVDDVRRRKGLRVEEKAVQSATKQRTLARKK